MGNPLQLSMVNFKKDAYIIVEGKAQSDYFYIIQRGRVRISKEVEVVEEEGGNVLGPGDFFGVVSTMSNHSHIETARAVDDVLLISVHRDQYGMLIEKNTPVAMKIIQGFSKKMRYLDEALTQLTFKNTAKTDTTHLFKVGEYYAKRSQYNQAYYAYYKYLSYQPDGPHVSKARERMNKITPYAKVAYLDQGDEDFTRSYPKNTMIFSEAEPGQELYIIQKGSVKITKIVDDNEVLLAMLKPGDIFGEMAILENKLRSASAIAYEDSVLLAVNRANFQRMVTSQPQIITKLTTLLAERIWFIYKQLANTLLSNPLGRMYDALLIQMEKQRVPLRQGEPHTFEFGPQELINMVGLQHDEGNRILHDLFQNSRLKVVGDRIHCTDVEEVEKQAKYYRKMEKIGKARHQQSSANPSFP